MNILELSEQEIVRRNNLQQLRDLGIDPYPAAEYPVTAWSTDIIKDFVDLPIIGKDEEGNDVRETATPENSPVVSVAGRIMSKRIMGKAAFAELQDSKGRIQVYVQRDAICPDENWTSTILSSRSASTWAISLALRVMFSAPRQARLASTFRK